MPNQTVLELAYSSGVYCEDCPSPDFYAVEIIAFHSSLNCLQAYGRAQAELLCLTVKTSSALNDHTWLTSSYQDPGLVSHQGSQVK